MKTQVVFVFLFIFLSGLFYAFAPVSFAEEDSDTFMLGEAQSIKNVLFCQDKNEALYIALREVEFFTAKKPIEEFKTEMDTFALACGVGKGIFVPLKIIHTYIGYYGDEMEPLEWNIVESKVGVNFKSVVYLFIPSILLSAH